jgi:hypothetical protein
LTCEIELSKIQKTFEVYLQKHRCDERHVNRRKKLKKMITLSFPVLLVLTVLLHTVVATGEISVSAYMDNFRTKQKEILDKLQKFPRFPIMIVNDKLVASLMESNNNIIAVEKNLHLGAALDEILRQRNLVGFTDKLLEVRDDYVGAYAPYMARINEFNELLIKKPTHKYKKLQEVLNWPKERHEHLLSSIKRLSGVVALEMENNKASEKFTALLYDAYRLYNLERVNLDQINQAAPSKIQSFFDRITNRGRTVLSHSCNTCEEYSDDYSYYGDDHYYKPVRSYHKRRQYQ